MVRYQPYMLSMFQDFVLNNIEAYNNGPVISNSQPLHPTNLYSGNPLNLSSG